MTRLADKVAFITGAGSGIGRASALRMAEEGASVMCTDIDGDAARATSLVIQQSGGKAEGESLNVTDSDAVKAMLKQTESVLGQLDVVFNNAGIAGAGDWDATISVNLTGVRNGCLHSAPMLAASGGGSIINTASVAGLNGLVGIRGEITLEELAAGAGAYVASKHGVVGLTRQFAVSFGRFNVRVNAVAPGYIETPMTAEAREIPGAVDFLASLHPMDRLGQPEEIAAAAAFLASDDASFVNGVILPVDGGYTAR